MILIDTALAQRAAAGRPIRVAIAGAGFMARGLANRIINGPPGMIVTGIYARKIDRGRDLAAYCGVAAVEAGTQGAFDAAAQGGTLAITEDVFLVTRSEHVDVIVGTHRLLSKDVVFRDLGLLIVDEEQRFGVQHKEQIKKMRTAVDVLTLTATPIPRTLEMSLTGIRDLSLVNTPPEDRQPILTYVDAYDPRANSEMALVLYLWHRPAAALRTVDRVLERDPNDPRASLIRGLILLRGALRPRAAVGPLTVALRGGVGGSDRKLAERLLREATSPDRTGRSRATDGPRSARRSRGRLRVE